MCGICGTVARIPGGEVVPDAVARMCATQRHRGPDDEGIYAAPGICLGATRLSIIDLEGGHQPIGNEDGTVWAVQNGEIYNFRELREQLLGRGHRFRSESDTEVLVHLYEDHGPDFVTRLRGMFALAVWDGRSATLVLARDRLGVKPLHYADTGAVLHFGSEIKSLLAAGLPRELDSVALHDYLTFDYVPGPRTMFAGVRKLAAGHLLIAKAGSPVELRRYWDFPPQPERAGRTARVDEAELARELRDRLTDAVRATLVSDVPVGAFLSGGLDSSVVVALMAQEMENPVRTFSIGFREHSYSELPQAGEIARLFGTEHTEILVEPRVEDMIHDLVAAYDEPFADSSAIASWYVARAASEHVKVVLSGDGGDEVFGGYVIYQADRLRTAYGRLPGWLSGTALPWFVDRLPASERKMSWDLRARRFVTHATADPLSAHVGWRTIFTDDMKSRLYAEGFAAPKTDSIDVMRRAFDGYRGADQLNRFMVVDAKVSLVDDMLTKVDRASMAHSLEVRVPLLDHELVEWMTPLPSRTKVRGLRLKHLFRRAAGGLLPADVVNRPKAGFHVPMPAWLKGELRPLVEDHLGAEALRRQGVFDPTYVRSLLDEHAAGRRDHSRNLWGLLVFGLWFDRYLGGST